FEAELALLVLDELQADVVPGRGRAVFGGTVDGDLELARQEGEFGMQRTPLAHDFGPGARVGHFVGRDAGERVARDVAYAVAAGLDAVQVDGGQQVHDVRAFLERNPVELHVLPRREVGVAGGEMAAYGLAIREADVAEAVLR